MSEEFKKYRRKDESVEAVQFTDENKDRVFNWITCSRSPGFGREGEPILRIFTPEGVLTSVFGDYVAKEGREYLGYTAPALSRNYMK